MTSNRRSKAVFFVLIIALIADIIVGLVSSVSIPVDPQVPLGQWTSFPLASQCSTGNYTAPVCELMGNITYRGALLFSSSDVSVQAYLTVSCITPSNTPGAFLQLQYANYSTTTHLNVSNFVNVGQSGVNGEVLIDNSNNWKCPGNLTEVANGFNIIPSGISVGGIVFRVVGSGGGGVGDNPRFSSIQVGLIQAGLTRIPAFIPISITASGFTALNRESYPVAVSTTMGFQWRATNTTNTFPTCGAINVCDQHGSGSCTIAVNGAACTLAITFSPAFSAAPNVVGSSTNTGVPYTFPIGTLNLLSAQTLTV